MRISTKLNIILSLVALLSLSACQAPKVYVGEDRAIQVEGPFAQDRTFVEVQVDASIREGQVFRVQDEVELALLVILHNLDELKPVTYLSERELNLTKVFAYVETILPYSFVLNLSSLTYNLQDEELLKLYELSIQPTLIDLTNLNTVLNQTHTVWVGNEKGLSALETIHDTLLLTTAYDESVLELDLNEVTDHPSFEAYGLLMTGTAVCSGYARAFNALALRSEVPSIMISAINMQHAFNMVYDGEQWVFVDVTFNDPIPDRSGRVLKTYYLLDEAALLALGKHTFDEGENARLTLDEYRAFAYALFPKTQP